MRLTIQHLEISQLFLILAQKESLANIIANSNNLEKLKNSRTVRLITFMLEGKKNLKAEHVANLTSSNFS